LHVGAFGYRTVAHYGLAATATSVGSGCGGAGLPLLSCTAPRIGQIASLALINTTPNASGFVYGSGIPASSYQLGAGCTVQLDLYSYVPYFSVATDGAGAWGISLLIPPNPSLAGTSVALQAALFPTAGPLGFDLSNAVFAVVGY
jgi:hypothetical protein